MTHEFKNIVYQAKLNQQNGLKNVLATVVHLEGSSYRKPGVRMLISENGTMVGAVSGGCVENDINTRAQSVFETNTSKVMTYDGRYRLGCEGILYILIEPFYISDVFLKAFQHILESRQEFQIQSYYQKKDDVIGAFGSCFLVDNNQSFTFSEAIHPKNNGLVVFSQTLKPSLKLLIIGGEHDAVKLCAMANLLGWEVDIITSIKDPKSLSDFPGAKSVTALTPEIADLHIDSETVVVLMTHNYVQDLKYLLKLEPFQLKYIGIIGSSKRRNQLESELLNYNPDIKEDFLNSIYSPAGLHIGAITPEEIALAIVSEILMVIRQTKPMSLRSITVKSVKK
ncbi:XdhC family protein [Psychroserpens algicola]|uniref:XdhC family protein n=1 Tax=Psychroserpens algicola TaxID=1719034 RepID=A0ABT0H7Y4_9FLAO|nr:XdhC/CoxI family protein [Psychroserpens algicola]MCK8480465.1 XdhC family protein [Psychroserpens algicola]